MSDLPKRLQEQAAANQKSLAYKQANARTARAARQQGQKRPTDPVEEKKKRKPVAAVQDEIGFRFYFTSSFLDLSEYFNGVRYPRSNHPIDELINGYQSLTTNFGDGWSTGVVQLASLPPDLSAAGYQLGAFSTDVPLYGSRWLDRLSSLNPATFPEVRLSPFSEMQFDVVQPSLVTTFEQVNTLAANNLLNGFDDGLEALETGSVVIAYEEAISWDVPAWPEPGSDPFRTTFSEPYTVPVYVSSTDSYIGPAVPLHTFRTDAIKTCQAASDSGAVVLVSSYIQSEYSFVARNYGPRLYKGLSGVDQGGNDALFDLLGLGVDALDLIVDLERPGISSALPLFNQRARFEYFLDQQHPAALRIEASLSDESRFCSVLPHRWQGLASVFHNSAFDFNFARDIPGGGTPYNALLQFLTLVNSARFLDPVERYNEIYDVLGPDFLSTPLSEERRRKAADIERVRIKTLQAAANAYFDLSTTLASGLPPLKSD
jgi:hypothetical protein